MPEPSLVGRAPRGRAHALVAYLANYYDLVWVLDEEQRELLLRLTPERLRRRPGRAGPSAWLRPMP